MTPDHGILTNILPKLKKKVNAYDVVLANIISAQTNAIIHTNGSESNQPYLHNEQNGHAR